MQKQFVRLSDFTLLWRSIFSSQFKTVSMYTFLVILLIVRTFPAINRLITLEGSFVQQLFRAQPADLTQLSYFAGLQLQLGGFGGINYTLHASNPAAMRPMELGMAEAGLTPPKLPTQAYEPAFAKVSSQGVIASFASPGTHVARKLP